jgi:uncharacterized protein
MSSLRVLGAAVTLRVLGELDAPPLEAFLAAHRDNSMILRSNLLHGGIVDRGEVRQGTWVAAFADHRIVAVAQHAWNGNLVLQAPVHVEDVASRAVAESGRPLHGLLGPHAQCVAARRALGRADAPMRHDTLEDLYVLDLVDLKVPPALAAGKVVCRHVRDEELELVTQWRHDFHCEGLKATPGPQLLSMSRGEIEDTRARGNDFLLLADGVPVSFAAFNARLPDMVQIGGVVTPREHRGRGYARAVVGGALLEARRAGVTRSVLFTGVENAPARAAYLALGYRIEGDYGFLLFA